jgi:uncharacterized pyridoxal phosphate-dependent enzyme
MIEDEVLDAIREAAKVYVDMSELHAKAGAYLAKLIGTEAAYVSAGAAAGLVLSVGACMTEGQTHLMAKLPRSDGMKNEVVVQKLHRNMHDHNLEVAGARIIEIGNEYETRPEDLENAFNERTAAVVYFVFDPQEGVLSLGDVIEMSHKRGIPVIVDAAAELPPKENLVKFIKMNADLVVFSGGKDIGAPNDTGIVLGRRDLVGYCMRLGPHSYEMVNSKGREYIGRPMKTSKEDILAFVVAVKRYLASGYDVRLLEGEKKVRYMVEELAKCNGVEVCRFEPGVGHNRPTCFPRVELRIKSERWSADYLAAELRKCDPPIYTYVMNGRLYINPQCLREGEENVVVTSLQRLLLRTS